MGEHYDSSGNLIDASNPLTVSGGSMPLSVEKTRPADTTAYAINDAIAESTSAGTSWVFAGAAGVPGTGGLITGAAVATDNAANTATLELDLYGADVTTPVQDNAEAVRKYADQVHYITTLVFPALAKHTADSDQAEAALTELSRIYGCAVTSLFGVLRTTSAFTPASAAHYRVTLFIAQG